jgi:hypothetical protein
MFVRSKAFRLFTFAALTAAGCGDGSAVCDGLSDKECSADTDEPEVPAPDTDGATETDVDETDSPDEQGEGSTITQPGDSGAGAADTDGCSSWFTLQMREWDPIEACWGEYADVEVCNDYWFEWNPNDPGETGGLACDDITVRFASAEGDCYQLPNSCAPIPLSDPWVSDAQDDAACASAFVMFDEVCPM